MVELGLQQIDGGVEGCLPFFSVWAYVRDANSDCGTIY